MDTLVDDLARYKTWINKKRSIKRLKVNDAVKDHLLHQNDLDYVRKQIEVYRQQFGDAIHL
jgi:deoxyadenosine/deoxycytidine kinase